MFRGAAVLICLLVLGTTAWSATPAFRQPGNMTEGNAASIGPGNTFQDSGQVLIMPYTPEQYGAAGDGVMCLDGAMAASSTTLTSNCATFTNSDIGKPIVVMGAGSAGAPLLTTIQAVGGAHSVTLAATASTTVPTYKLLSVTVQTAQSGGGSYAAGNTVTLTGCTGTNPILTIAETQLVSDAVNAPGSGYSTGDSVVFGQTGGTQLLPLTGTVTASAGLATALMPTIGGSFQGNPTAFSQSSTSGGGSGLTLNTLVYGPLYAAPTNQGACTVIPANPIAQGSTSGSGTGATFNGVWAGGVYGIDGAGRFGASGNIAFGTSNDTAFKTLAQKINASPFIKSVSLAANAVYVVHGVCAADQDVLLNLSGQSGLTFYDNGATIVDLCVNNSLSSYFLQVSGSHDTRVIGLQGFSAQLNVVNGKGVNWITLSGSSNTRAENLTLTGGVNGVACSRVLGSGAYHPGLYVTGDFAYVGYPVSNQSDCPGTEFRISTRDADRSYIGYNVSNVRGAIFATFQDLSHAPLSDVEVACYGAPGYDISNWRTSTVDIDYTNLNSSRSQTASLSLEHNQANAAAGAGPCGLDNIHAKLNISYLWRYQPSTTPVAVSTQNVSGGIAVSGDTAGNVENNITIEGRIAGIIGGGGTGLQILAPAKGFSGLTVARWLLDQLNMPNDAHQTTIGAGATVQFVNSNFPAQSAPAVATGAVAQYEGTTFSAGLINTIQTPLTMNSTGTNGNYTFARLDTLGGGANIGTTDYQAVDSTATTKTFAQITGVAQNVSGSGNGGQIDISSLDHNTNVTQFSVAPTAVQYRNRGHLVCKAGTHPTIASGQFGTGTSAALASYSCDQAGRLTVGTGGAASGVVTFGTSYTQAPTGCQSVDETAGTNLVAVATTSQLTITGSMSASDVVSWSCDAAE